MMMMVECNKKRKTESQPNANKTNQTTTNCYMEWLIEVAEERENDALNLGFYRRRCSCSKKMLIFDDFFSNGEFYRSNQIQLGRISSSQTKNKDVNTEINDVNKRMIRIDE